VLAAKQVTLDYFEGYFYCRINMFRTFMGELDQIDVWVQNKPQFLLQNSV
jgi:hypothetical protein